MWHSSNREGNFSWEHHVTNIKKKQIWATFHSSKINLHFSFSERKSFFPATNGLPPQPESLAHNTTTSMDKLSFTISVDFGKHQNFSGQFSRCKKSSNYLDAKLKFFKKNDNQIFCLVQIFTMGVRFQPIHAIEEPGGHCSRRLWWWSNSVPYTDTNNVEDVVEQLKLSHSLIDVVDCPNRKICVTLLPYIVDKTESCSYAQFQFFAGKKEEEELQKLSHVN